MASDQRKFIEEKPKQFQNSWLSTITIVLSVSAVMLSTGISVGSFNAATNNLKIFFNQTYQERNNGTSISEDTLVSLIANSGSIMLAGGFFGSSFSFLILPYVGRKFSTSIMNSVNIVSVLLVSVTTFRLKSYESFIVGRAVFGLCSGFGMNLIPLLVSEISTPNKQAFYLSLIGVNLSAGGLIGLCMGFEQILGAYEFTPLLLSLQGIPSIVYFLAYKWLPDSPYTLMRQGRKDDAVATLKKLRTEISLQEINSQLDAIHQQQNQASSGAKRVSIVQMFTASKNLRIMIALLILYVQAQLCGINGIGMYSNELFLKADFTPQDSQKASALVFLLQFLVAFVGSIGVDKFGPKLLNVMSSFVMAFSLVVLIVSMTYTKEVFWFKYLSVAAVATFIVFWACGVNLTLFPMLAAYSTDETRESGFAVGGAVFWFFSWFVAFIFMYMLEAMKQWTFVPLIITNVGFALYVLLRMPETRGRTAKEVTDMIQGIRSGSEPESAELL